ncbi:hypothetical protein [Mesorhizobium sp. YM1C-6-2]|jgi:hypothetical protein|uniref:hypothetical protein n=1 Tax=Mesorhizobium sp. YM1C-6-2 TaxID=1827501 RepID=UPI000EF21E5A|nr:hypothetical protein [Mesorhizobium sp. YM1C-6-2]MDQ2706028.1 hypothetical protein [Pseudomonadota bacterium]RLP25332.1 hypothetical protein D8676_12925 [Mesorhizobium sp. YM1C-6-2]
MTRHLETTLKCLRLLPRAMVVILAISAPILMVPSLRAADQTTIEAPALKKTGAGFVLMVSLQRA